MTRGHEILGYMWVYIYKSDKYNRLTKVKARLVVRGDQQRKGLLKETYTATLAGKSFRTMMAIMARFDLEARQYDVVNAFYNARMTNNVFMRPPPGYPRSAIVLKLERALYGLRESPLLWQKEISSSLKALGFAEVPHEPCYIVRRGIVIFFYVDDFVVLFRAA